MGSAKTNPGHQSDTAELQSYRVYCLATPLETLPEELLHRSLVAERPRLPESRVHSTSQVLGVPGSRYLNPRSMKRTVSSLSGEPAAGQGSGCVGPV